MSVNDHALGFAACKEMTTHLIKSRIVPCIESSPGMGKSAMAKLIAKELDLCLIDIRLSTIDPADLNGFVTVVDRPLSNGQTAKVATYLPIEIWPIEGTPLPINPETNQPYRGWLIFLDELRAASPDTQAAAYRLLLDHEVGNYKLDKRVVKMCATNGVDDNAVAYDAGTAMQSRLAWLKLKSDLEDWVEMAQANDFDVRVIGYIQWKGLAALNNFRPDHSEVNFGCERTWHTLSKAIKKITTPDVPMKFLPMMAGIVGHSLATEFQGFTSIYNQLDTFDTIINNPTGVVIDKTRPDILYAMVSRIQAEIDPTKVNTFIDPLMQYVTRLPIEFQSMILKTILTKTPQLAGTCPAVKQWIAHNAQRLTNKQTAVAAQPMPTQATVAATDDDDDQP